MTESSHSSKTIDPLGWTGKAFIREALEMGIPAVRSRAAYRDFFRKGIQGPEWLKPFPIEIGQTQTEGQTVKFTLNLPQDVETESVLIPMPRASGDIPHTLCVSSQIGCAMGCRFCETAQMGLIGNLTVSQIVAQWYAATYTIGNRPTNIVFMGMGEPTDNLDAVIPAIRVLTDHDGASVAASKISVSTVGNPAGIRRLGDLAAEPGFHRLNLAVSLNAPNDDIRHDIMPAGRAWPMDDLMDAMLGWRGRPSTAICIEYVLIPGVNDGPEHCDQVCEYLKPLHCTLNVIPYNPRRDSPWPAPSEESVADFMNRAIENGQFTKRRGTKGRSVMAACGQLGNPDIRRRTREGQPVRITMNQSRGAGG